MHIAEEGSTGGKKDLRESKGKQGKARESMNVSRPILRWHGGKWRLAPWIIDNLPPHRTYVEPYGGAASVLIRKPRSYAEVYNDLDGDVVNLFQVLRERPDDLARAVALTPYAEEEFRLSKRGDNVDPLERARRLCVRSWMGHGANAATSRAGFRRDTKRRGTVAATDWHRFPLAVSEVAERFRGVVIEQREAALVMGHHDSPETLHYVDPPYPAGTRDVGRDYRHEMSDLNHEELAETLKGLKGMVVLSGYDNPLYDRLYAGWIKTTTRALADGGRERVEVLWFSPSCPGRGLFQTA